MLYVEPESIERSRQQIVDFLLRAMNPIKESIADAERSSLKQEFDQVRRKLQRRFADLLASTVRPPGLVDGRGVRARTIAARRAPLDERCAGQ
jgi:hypothetical protein